MPTVQLQNRAVLRLSGPDTRSFLQGLITQDINSLTVDTPIYAGLLSPQGKTLFAFTLFEEAVSGDILLETGADQIAPLAKRLKMFRLRKQVEIQPDTNLSVWQCWGDPCDHPADPRTPQSGSRFLAAAESAPVETASLEEWHTYRLQLGLPEEAEIGQDQFLWLETNGRELNGVSFTKGCYTGQENTARMHHRDKLRKRLLPIDLGSIQVDETSLMSGEKEAGQLVGERHGHIQMALFRMDFVDQPLTLAGQPVRLIRPDWLPND